MVVVIKVSEMRKEMHNRKGRMESISQNIQIPQTAADYVSGRNNKKISSSARSICSCWQRLNNKEKVRNKVRPHSSVKSC
jgi:hypothetical protein